MSPCNLRVFFFSLAPLSHLFTSNPLPFTPQIPITMAKITLSSVLFLTTLYMCKNVHASISRDNNEDAFSEGGVSRIHSHWPKQHWENTLIGGTMKVLWCNILRSIRMILTLPDELDHMENTVVLIHVKQGCYSPLYTSSHIFKLTLITFTTVVCD